MFEISVGMLLYFVAYLSLRTRFVRHTAMDEYIPNLYTLNQFTVGYNKQIYKIIIVLEGFQLLVNLLINVKGF